MQYLIVSLIGYFLGCSNMAYYLAKAKGVDMTSKGSGNPGTSNAVILMGWRSGVLVGFHDIGKAVVAVLLAKLLFPEVQCAGEAAGTACVLGHIFPVFFKFKGGKGFASFVGMMLALDWRFALIVLALVVVVTILSDYLVVGTTLTVFVLPVYLVFSQPGWLPAAIVFIASLTILFMHRMNYVRIWNRSEIGLRSTIKGEHRE